MKNQREVSYKEFDTWQQGWFLLATGGMMGEPIIIVERSDGTITKVPIDKVQFNDRVGAREDTNE